MMIHPTRQEIVLASNLVLSQFRAICEVFEAARHDWAPPVEPTLDIIFCFSEPAFRDHISEAFADAAQERVPFFGFWERSCHQSVRAAGNQIKRLLLPDRKAFDIRFDAVDRVRIAEEVTPERYRKYFEASIPAATVKKIKANWRQSKLRIRVLGVSGYEGFEFALQRELAQAKRDLHSAVLRQAENTVPAQPGDNGESSGKRDDALPEFQDAVCGNVTLPAQGKSTPLPPVNPLDEFEKEATPRVRKLFKTLFNHSGRHQHSRVEQWYVAGADQHFEDGSFTDLVRQLDEALSKWGRKSEFKIERRRGSKFKEAEVELVGDRQGLASKKSVENSSAVDGVLTG